MRLFFKWDNYDSGVGLFFHEADTDTSKTMICAVVSIFCPIKLSIYGVQDNIA